VMKTMPVSAILADRPGDFPPGPKVILPTMVKEAAPAPCHYIDADEPFLMLFTGGSTGTPKVWAKTPRNMIEEARYMTARFGITAEDIFLSTVPPQHIYGLLFSVLVPLMAGARVLEGIYVFPREILNVAGESGATVLVSVPACYRVLKGDSLERHSLRLAFSSAGALDPGDADHFREKTSLDINEIYGSTETGGVATRRRGGDGDAWNGLDPVAWRIAEGRLQVRSPFISPSLPRNEEGFFVTADRAEEDGKGRFILRGRADDVVKIGGKRVDLAEIQEKIRKIEGIRDALVVMLPRARGRQTDLAALVVTELDLVVLRQQMAGLIEPYAMPRRFVAVDKIPVTPTGKYDRQEIEHLLKPGRA
jgi:acyl-coenzyme A synthetase/AMP-(fatty) acid ligase